MLDSPRIKDYANERRTFASRIIIAAAGIGLLVLLLAARMVYLQGFKHDYFTLRADDNRMRIEVVPPVRGLIYDRNGILLADNLPSYRLEIVPEQVEDLDGTLRELAKLVEIRDSDLERFHSRVRREPRFRGIPLRSLLSHEEVANFEVNRQRFPGVNIVAGLTRNYPLGKTAAHLIGYVGGVTEEELKKLDERRYRGASHIGKTGVEKSYEDILHGDPGSRVTEANAAGRLLRQLDYKPPRDGKNLYLTVDARVQIAAEQALGAEDGAVVAIDPATGGILALVSEPSFEPSLFIDGIDHKNYQLLRDDPHRPLFNRALQGTYPPGSTAKPFMALAGLEYGAIGAHERKHCKGFHQIPGSSRRYRDWKRGGHGSVDLDLSIVQSCDVYYYQLGAELGVDRIHDFLDRFGFGHVTGVDLPGEKKGLLPSSQWKRKALKQKWYAGETLSVAIGQGYLNVTPLQLTHATAMLARRGRSPRPHVLAEVHDPGTGQRRSHTPPALAPIKLRDPSLWQPVLDGMAHVVSAPNGTAHRISRDAPFSIAGKTGTAQVVNMTQAAYVKSEHMRKEQRDHAWFIAFAPVEDPKIALTILAEHGGHGGSTAAPIARQVIDAYLLADAPPPAASEPAP